MTTTFLSTAGRSTLIAMCFGGAISLVGHDSYGQPQQPRTPDGPASGSAQQASAPVNPQSLSCNDLKAQVKSAGQLQILSGPKGAWGDTFYGPAVPRCQFWQMPLFAYVTARDGRCGVGYICIDKPSMD